MATLLAIILFGLDLDPLYNAIAQVESDDGKTSANVYQIEPTYVRDVNRILRVRRFAYRDTYYRDASEDMMLIYWEHYGKCYERETGKAPTYEVLARIHNGGPKGWRKTATVKYWAKVKKELNKLTNKGELK